MELGSSESSEKKKFDLSRLMFVLIFIVLATNILVGALWIFLNINFIPEYGDTSEYLKMSETLVVDQYRGILYPLVIRGATWLALASGYTMQSLIYLFQLVMVFVSTYFFSSAVSGNVKRPIVNTIIAACLVVTPLVAHFSLSLLTDSLAASLTVAFAAALVRFVKCRCEPKSALWYLALAAILVFLMSIIRVDKLYLGVAVYTVVLFIAVRSTRANGHSLRVPLLGGLMLIVAASMSVGVTKMTTVHSESRPPLDFSSMSFNRAVWPRMSEAYPYFSESVKNEVSIEDAQLFDSHNNYVYPFLFRVLAKPGGKQLINEMTLVTAKEFPVEIAGAIAFDFLKYSLPNFQFMLESWGVLPESVGTSWTISRMEMNWRSVTKLYLGGGYLLVVMLTVLLAVSVNKAFIKELRTRSAAVFILTAIVITNSALFTLNSGMHAHIRYALPTFHMVQIIMLVTAAYFLGHGLRGRHYASNDLSESATRPGLTGPQ